VLNVGAGWPAKQWPPESFAALADALLKDFALAAILNCGPGEEALAVQVRQSCRLANPQPYLGDLKGLIALLRRSRLMVGPDSGPLHLAAALNVPTVGLFGPTDPSRNGPYGMRYRTLRPPGAQTSYRHSASAGSIMRRISPEGVLEAIRALFEEEGSGWNRSLP